MKLEALFEESKAEIARRIIRQVTSRSEFMQQANEAGITSPHTRQLYFSKFRSELGQGVEGFTPPTEKQRGSKIKLKWQVMDAPTGRYRSFERRGWPMADYPDGRPALAISSEDEYVPRKVKTGDHSELILRIADYSSASPQTGAFQWKQVKRRFSTLAELKTVGAQLINGQFNYMAPPEFQTGKKTSTAKKQQQVSDQDLLNAVGELLSTMKRQQRYNTGMDQPTMNGNQATAGIRDWGQWENPHDAPDEEDYDWQRLSDRSRGELEKLLSQFSKQYPNIKFEISTEEKNWIMLYATRR